MVRVTEKYLTMYGTDKNPPISCHKLFLPQEGLPNKTPCYEQVHIRGRDMRTSPPTISDSDKFRRYCLVVLYISCGKAPKPT